MATREFILTVMVLHSFATSLVLAQNVNTYVREFPSGRKVTCELCAPGFHLQKHCTETQRTVCQPCSVGFYTAYRNYIYDCLPCSRCSSDQVETQKCTSTSNRVCACKEGFYWDSYFCRRHTACQKGYRVKENGTSDKDTVCERCEKGYYSSGQPENTQCLPHTKCKAEEKLLFHGTSCMDNVCATCNEIELGWVNLIKQPFLEVFKNHSSRKVQRFIRSLTNSTDGPTKDYDYFQDHDMQKLQQWFSSATEQQVIDLPKQLQKKCLNLATKFKHRIKKILDEVSLCQNVFSKSL